jgi:hypothetical protein
MQVGYEFDFRISELNLSIGDDARADNLILCHLRKKKGERWIVGTDKPF